MVLKHFTSATGQQRLTERCFDRASAKQQSQWVFSFMHWAESTWTVHRCAALAPVIVMLTVPEISLDLISKLSYKLALLYRSLFHFQCLTCVLLSPVVWIHLRPIQPPTSCLLYNLDLSLPATGLLIQNSAHHEGLLRALLPWRISVHIFLYNCKITIIKKGLIHAENQTSFCKTNDLAYWLKWDCDWLSR